MARRQVEPEIVEGVRRFSHKGLSSIAFHRRGRLGASREEAMPIVLVFVRKGFRADFSILKHRLLHILEGLEISIKLEIQIGSITAV